jgi:hypothetical protein
MATASKKHGLSKTTNLSHDIAKKGAVKLNKQSSIAVNHRVTASSPAAHPTAGGKAKTHTDGSTSKGFKKGVKP